MSGEDVFLFPGPGKKQSGATEMQSSQASPTNMLINPPLQPPRWRTALQTPSLDRPQRQTTQTRTVNNPLTVANSQHGLAHHTGDWSLFVSFFFLLEGRGTVKESQYLNNRFFFFKLGSHLFLDLPVDYIGCCCHCVL